jgi:hypothetical protein
MYKSKENEQRMRGEKWMWVGNWINSQGVSLCLFSLGGFQAWRSASFKREDHLRIPSFSHP